MTRSTRLTMVLAVNAALVIAQVATGLAARSSGLLADAAHNLTDVAAVGLSLLALRWAGRPRSEARSFGNHRGTILAALGNSAGLAVVTGAIVVWSVVHLVHPARVDGPLVAAVAAGAVVVNLVALLVVGPDGGDLNLRSVVVHMASDALSSASVLAAGVAIAIGGAGWDRADPIASLVVALLVVREAIRLSRQSVDVLLESTPRGLDLGALRTSITAVPGIADVHDLHVWSLSSDVRALSAHLVLSGTPSLESAQLVTGDVRDAVVGPFAIAHTTFELESERCVGDEADPCEMDEIRTPVLARRNPE
ncbi:MAG TPA: cation diffusion facilitator family transporter [Acidimicrobiales bacterium]